MSTIKIEIDLDEVMPGVSDGFPDDDVCPVATQDEEVNAANKTSCY